MCGIAGIIGHNKSESTVAILRMTDRLKHRGPDDGGYFVNEGVALGQRRLSILDLSSEGRQPMWTEDGRYAIVYNGEVYNYASIRARLEDAGHVFHSETDTEVILKAYATWGCGCLEHFNGMFAFAIYDSYQEHLLIARDRLGIKPLYYAQTSEGVLVFASELQALLSSNLVDRKPNRKALPMYLKYQTVPAPDTLIEGVKVLLPGHVMEVGAGKVTISQYWHLLENADAEAANQELGVVKKEVRRRLTEAVERRLVSDVPLGAFLSGGIDSSLIVGLMSRIHRQQVKTFSVVFDHPDFQDGHYAEIAAKHFKTDHTAITLTESDILDQIPDALASQDHPSGDGINTFIVSKAVREAGLTVALSGLGGDEFFAGYSLFKRLGRQQRARRLWQWSPRLLRGYLGDMLYAANPSIATEKIKGLLSSDGSLASVYPLGRQCFSFDQVARLLHEVAQEDDAYASMLTDTFERASRSSLLSRISFAEARTYMHDVLLRDADQMSMAHALEVRVPFLDHKLVEYVMGVSDPHKWPNGVPKQLLVASLEGMLPPEIIHRPKQGFIMPFDAWMKGPLKSLCLENLEYLASSPAFEAQTVYRYWLAFIKGEKIVSWSRIWLLVALGAWFRRQEEEVLVTA